MRAILLYLVAGAVLVLNPFFACNAEPVFLFGLADVERALAGTWDATWTRDGKTESARFRVEPAGAQRQSARGWINSASACSNRTLIKSAHACADETIVPLVLIALDGSTQTMSGTFYVNGTRFARGHARLELGDVTLGASVSSTGVVSDLETSTDVIATLRHAN